MSDFKEIADFRKGYRTGNANQFGDPTMLSFALMFDFTDGQNSPMLGKGAETFLMNNVNSAEADHRIKALADFVKVLKKINGEMPWYWQSLNGIELLQQYDAKQGYRGGDNSKLTIGTLESIDLTISGLMHLYRTAVFDEKKWNYVIPANLRKFRMWVYVTEVRSIKSHSLSGTHNRPYFMFELGSCEFDIKSGVNSFTDLNKSPEGFASSEIIISYEKVGTVDARVLKGSIEESENDTSRMSPAGTYETNNVFTKEDSIVANLRKRTENFKDDASILAAKKKQQIEQVASNIITANTPNLTNIYQNFIKDIDNATNVQTLSSNLPDNIFGNSETVHDALNNNAIAGLRIGENVNTSTSAGNTMNTNEDLGNIYE